MTNPVNVTVERKITTSEPPESYFVPATDVYETGDELVLIAEVPGVTPEGLIVTVEDNVLVIRATPPAAGKAGETLLEEFTTGEYYRAFQLPADYDTDRIQASLKQGVLTLRLPKSERMKPRRIEVKPG